MPTKVLVVAGPTAMGKSQVALKVCEDLNGEIVSADSVQLYKGLDIGSNKPDLATRRLRRHHIVDVAEAVDPWSAGRWLRAARTAIRDCTERGKVPVVVGGTMMYVRWLIRGPPDAPKASAGAVEQADKLLRDCSWENGLRILRDHDVTTDFSENDWYRLSRALEIALDKDTRQQKVEILGLREDPNFDPRCIFLAPTDRQALFHRIDDRCDTMLNAGLITEVADLLATDRLRRDSPAGRAIGYRQAIDFLDTSSTNSTDYIDFCKKFATATRNYAGEQIKWYRRDHDFAIVSAEDNDDPLTAVLNAFHLSRPDYDTWLAGDDQKKARESLVADKHVMRLFIPHPPQAATDDVILQTHLDRVTNALARLPSSNRTEVTSSSSVVDDNNAEEDTSSTTKKLNTTEFRLTALQNRETRSLDS